MSVMIGGVTERLAPDSKFMESDGLNGTLLNVTLRDEERVRVAAAVTLLSGIFQVHYGSCSKRVRLAQSWFWSVLYTIQIQMCFARLQILLGLVQFGFVVTYLSEPLVRGYTTGAAIHVIVSQLKYTFGINPERYNGPLALIYVRRNYVQRILDCMQLRFIVEWQFCKSNTWRHCHSQLLFFPPRHFLQTVLEICFLLPKTNIGTLVVSAVTIVCLIIAKELNAYLSKKIPVPIPVELLAVSTTHTRGHDQTCASSSRPNCSFRRLLLPQSFRGRLT